MYAFVNILPATGSAITVYDNLTAKIRAHAQIDAQDYLSPILLNTRDRDNTEHAALQYLDDTGAKIRIGILEPRYGPVTADTVTILLGYAGDSVPANVVQSKVAELIQDAKEACDYSGLTCSITERIIEQPPAAAP